LQNLQASGVALDAEVSYFDIGFSNFITQKKLSDLLT
jgi:hypothetical protein